MAKKGRKRKITTEHEARARRVGMIDGSLDEHIECPPVDGFAMHSALRLCRKCKEPIGP